jgi:hypothetical protein
MTVAYYLLGLNMVYLSVHGVGHGQGGSGDQQRVIKYVLFCSVTVIAAYLMLKYVPEQREL